MQTHIMKNKFTRWLLAGALTCGSLGIVQAQTDVTQTYVKNPSFESNFTDWEYTNMQTQTNTSFTKKSGSVYIEQWVGTGSRVANAQVSQTLTSLPNGVYKLTVAAQNIQQNTSTAQTGAYIFADDEEKTVTAANDYSVTFTVIDSQALIGFKAQNATGNWIACDNFRLYSVSSDLTAMHEELQQRIDQAQELTDGQMSAQVRTELNAAIQEAQQEMQATTADNLTSVAIRLREATAQAQTSIETYQTLQKVLEQAQPLVDEKMQNAVRTELNAAIQAAQGELQNTTENLVAVTEQLTQATEKATASIQAYKTLQNTIDEALAVYGDGSQTGADVFQTAIQAAQKTVADSDAEVEDLAQATNDLSTAALAFRMANASGTVPTVVTNKQYARGATMAFGRSSISGVNMSQLLEHGFCWSTDPEPTILDHRTTEYLTNNGYIYKIKDLQPATVYYMRAYAMTKDYAVGYGDVIKVITIPLGNVTYTYNNGGPADANARIDAALVSAVDYWNNLTSIRGFKVTCNYGADTPTADCSYGGWMRVGPDSSYQRTGTIMHEMGHGVGVGTHSVWQGPDSPLRGSGNTGTWLGDRANAVLRFWDNDSTETMTGDGTHMWPYGINGAQEDNGSEVLYIGNSLITQALGEDGLPPTGGFSTPAYVFEQEDNVTYYIKNESETYGLYTAYLTSNDAGVLKWQEATTEEALADDNMAWYITFNPANDYYQLRNAATGKYLTYSGSSFRVSEKATPSATENFHLMRGRIDVSAGTGANAFTTRGYWIIHPENQLNPPCLGARSGGRTETATFDLGNSADAQRWVILTGDEIQTFGSAVMDERKNALNDMLEQIKALAATPHTEDVAGTDETLSTTLADIETKGNAPEATSEDIATLTDEALTAGLNFLAEATPSSVEQPFDLTFLLSDASLTDGNGWTGSPTINFSCGEFYQKTFDFYQTVRKLPAGTYQFKGQAFQRPGTTAEAYNAYVSGDDKVNTVIYAGTDEAKVENIAAEAQTKSLGGGEVTVGSSPVKYVPNDMEAASKYFAAGLYDNGVVTELTKDNSSLKMGLRCTASDSFYWSIFDNFRLYYYGTMNPDIVNAIHPAFADPLQDADPFATPADIYNLSGICVRKQATSLEGLSRGVYIVKGKKLLVK
ncbi:MAG: hypothetical protein LUC45_02720 [Paraprevotella sp.]|nr:hypothetical protein [Paraprevotella sp.]